MFITAIRSGAFFPTVISFVPAALMLLMTEQGFRIRHIAAARVKKCIITK